VSPVNRGIIARTWTQYAATLPEGTKAESIRDARRSYYAGARGVLTLIREAASQDDVAIMAEINRELAAFAEAVQAGTM
jgi:hypothetical protein